MKTIPAILLMLVLSAAAFVTSRPKAVATDSVKPLKTAGDCTRLGDSVMALIGQGQATNVYNLVEKHHAGSLEREQVVKSVEQSKAFAGVAGQMTGFELLSQRNVGPSILILRYLEKHEKGAMLWTLRFYRPVDRWLIDGVQMVGRTDLGELVNLVDGLDPAQGNR